MSDFPGILRNKLEQHTRFVKIYCQGHETGSLLHQHSKPPF